MSAHSLPDTCFGLRGQHRVDGVGRLKFDFHTGFGAYAIAKTSMTINTASPSVRDGGDSVVSAARRRRASRWRANADMIDSCCWSESAVAVVAKGTGSYLTDAMA